MVVTKLRSQLSVVSGRVWVYLEKAEATLTPSLKKAAEELREVWQHSREIFRRLVVSSRGAVLVADEKFTRVGSEISSVSGKAMVHVRVAQEAAAALGRIGADKAQKLRQESQRDLRRLGVDCRHAIVAAGGKIAGLGSQVSAVSHEASKRGSLKLQKAQSAAIGLARNFADKPRRVREAREAREKDLRSLLADSPDAIVVTDSGRRLVAANQKALELFGISEFNFGNFTLDTFVPNFGWSESSSESQGDRRSRCKIRRLDGGLRVAECELVAGIVPHRCLYKFLNVAPYKIAPPEFARGTASAAQPRTVKSPPTPNRAAPAQKAPQPGVRPGL